MSDAREPMHVSYREAVGVWLRIAALSFGGPSSQIAVMHRILVDEKKWISESRFLHALNYCMLLPGPEAQQLATYIGWLLHGWIGGLTAGLLFIAPGFVSILALSIAYAMYQQQPAVLALLFGLKASMLVLVAAAVLRLGQKILTTPLLRTLAACSLLAIFFFEVPFPWIVLVAGLFGFVVGYFLPHQLTAPTLHAKSNAEPMHAADRAATQPAQVSLARTCAVVLLWLAIWSLPFVIVASSLGTRHVLFSEATLFSSAAIVTFGGAYSVLSYIAQQAVERYGWLKAPEMLDGLGMAETTPGPLIMVVQFVGFLAAYRNCGEMSPLLAGILGSVVTVWVTFAPCFLYIFAGAPYIELLRNNKRISHALAAITAAVLGVMTSLALWLTIQTLFAVKAEHHFGPVRYFTVAPASLSLGSLLITLVAGVLLFRYRLGIATTLGIALVLGIVCFYIGVK